MNELLEQLLTEAEFEDVFEPVSDEERKARYTEIFKNPEKQDKAERIALSIGEVLGHLTRAAMYKVCYDTIESYGKDSIWLASNYPEFQQGIHDMLLDAGISETPAGGVAEAISEVLEGMTRKSK
jgi:hypothetical protein